MHLMHFKNAIYLYCPNLFLLFNFNFFDFNFQQTQNSKCKIWFHKITPIITLAYFV